MAIFSSIKSFVVIGGPAAWVILGLSLVLVAVSIERFRYLYLEVTTESDSAWEKVRSYVLSKDYSKALQACNQESSSPSLSVLKAGLLSLDNGREAIKSALGDSMIDIAGRCEARLPIISMIASISTLLGLLGTIFGLIRTFSALAVADTSQKASILGSGISEAMYSTAFSLIVAVTAMVAYTVFNSRSERIIASAQQAGHRFINWIEQSERN